MLEAGDTSTAYEPYVEKKIYTKNDNGNYEEFLNVEKTNNLQNYSTEEQVIGTWIDGKPIYRKVVSVGVLPSNTTKYVSSGISGKPTIIKMCGYAYRPTDPWFLTLPHISATAPISLSYGQTKNEIAIASVSDVSAYSGYVTLEYTKTTD